MLDGRAVGTPAPPKKNCMHKTSKGLGLLASPPGFIELPTALDGIPTYSSNAAGLFIFMCRIMSTHLVDVMGHP